MRKWSWTTDGFGRRNVDAGAFLNLAHELLSSTDNEAALRTSVSRSYYALHNHLAKFVNDVVCQLPKDASKHEKVYRWLHNCDVDAIRAIARSLDTLREARNEADYDLDSSGFMDVMRVTLLYTKARDEFKRFSDFTKSAANRRKIKEGIEAYRARTNS